MLYTFTGSTDDDGPYAGVLIGSGRVLTTRESSERELVTYGVSEKYDVIARAM